jgi:hypothetical protein
VAAGFGAMALLRTRLAVVKSAEGKEISIGPDLVITVLLETVDRYIDRGRARIRQGLIEQSLPDLRTLAEKGDFLDAYQYLAASLYAFQNLSDELRSTLTTMRDQYEELKVPLDIKLMALGFVFLTVVGERHFDAVLGNAKKMRLKTANGSGAGDVP